MQNCDGLLGLSSASLSKKLQMLSRVTDSCASRSKAAAWLDWLCVGCSLPLLESIAHSGFTVQQSAQLCDLSERLGRLLYELTYETVVGDRTS